MIKDRLIELGISQFKLAEELDVTEATVSRWIHGQHVPNIKYIKQMSHILNMPYEELINKFYR